MNSTPTRTIIPDRLLSSFEDGYPLVLDASPEVYVGWRATSYTRRGMRRWMGRINGNDGLRGNNRGEDCCSLDEWPLPLVFPEESPRSCLKIVLIPWCETMRVAHVDTWRKLANWGPKIFEQKPVLRSFVDKFGKIFKRTRHAAYQVEDSGFLAFASGIFLCEVFGSRIYSYSWILQGLSRYFWSRSSIHWMGMIQWPDDGDVGTFYYIKLGNKNLLVFCCKKIDFFFFWMKIKIISSP